MRLTEVFLSSREHGASVLSTLLALVCEPITVPKLGACAWDWRQRRRFKNTTFFFFTWSHWFTARPPAPPPPAAPPTEGAAAAGACLLIKTPVSNYSWALCGGWLDDLDPDLQSDAGKIHLDQWNGREPDRMVERRPRNARRTPRWVLISRVLE